MKKLITIITLVLMTIIISTLFITKNKYIGDDGNFRLKMPGEIVESEIDKDDQDQTVFHKGKVVKEEIEIPNINGKDVRVGFLNLKPNQHEYNNPTFAQAEIIYNAIRYKMKFPEENVEIRISSFHFSSIAAASVDPDSVNYGKVKGLGFENYDEEGYVRLVYLLVLAAKYEINVKVLGQLSSPSAYVKNQKGEIKYVDDIPIDVYFKDFYDQKTYNKNSDKIVSDYLEVIVSKWTSYGDRASSDMMHLKYLNATNILDRNNRIHTDVSLFTSQNIDSIDYKGLNTGNNSSNTGYIIINHEILSKTSNNYFDILFNHSSYQEDVYKFREKINYLNKKQSEMIENNEEINSDDQILYLGTPQDPVFEIYFTPLPISPGSFETGMNPYSKYTSEMFDSDDYIEFLFFNTKFVESSFTNLWVQLIETLFIKNNNVNSLFVMSNSMNHGFKDIQIGENVRNKVLGIPGIHSKDLLISYKKNDERKHLLVHSSTNAHDGAFTHQANFMLVIKNKSIYENYIEYNNYDYNTSI